jgi:hypothetical protein
VSRGVQGLETLHWPGVSKSGAEGSRGIHAVRSKSDIGQMNEVLCKVLCRNLCVIIQAIHELGIEPRFGTQPSSIINPIFH